MKRWQEEKHIALRRWRHEIAAHGGHPGWRTGTGWYNQSRGTWVWWGNGWLSAPVPPIEVCEDDCHCFRGPGYFRKRRPFESDSWYDGKKRATEKRKAIDFELANS